METPTQLEQRLLATVSRTLTAHEVLAPNDRILVALSGGKDSYAMFTLLHGLRPRLGFPVELIGVHLDQAQPGYDGAPLVRWLQDTGHRFEILREDTYSVVTERLPAGSTYCSMCSRLRRGVLYTAAERLGCNKVALGHHRDDAIETLLMNLFFAGKVQAMPAIFTTDDGRFQVIRPLIEVAEADLVAYAAQRAFPILPCNLCGSQEGLQREQMSRLIAEMERTHPHVRSVLLQATRNVRPTHLLDRDVARAWAERDPSIRPAPTPSPRPQHAKAQAVLVGGTEPPPVAPSKSERG